MSYRIFTTFEELLADVEQNYEQLHDKRNNKPAETGKNIGKKISRDDKLSKQTNLADSYSQTSFIDEATQIGEGTQHAIPTVISTDLLSSKELSSPPIKKKKREIERGKEYSPTESLETDVDSLWNLLSSAKSSYTPIMEKEDDDLDNFFQESKRDCQKAGSEQEIISSKEIIKDRKTFVSRKNGSNSAAKVSKKLKPCQMLEESSELLEDDEKIFQVRPQFGIENIVAQECTSEMLDPLILDANHHVHPFANRYLRAYQKEGIQFLFDNEKKGIGSVLNDDMGLGKTVQIICLCLALLHKNGTIADKKRTRARKSARKSNAVSVYSPDIQGTILIISPKSVLHQWIREFETWGYFDVEVLNFQKGDEAKEDLAFACKPIQKDSVPCNPEILLTTYSVLAKPANDRLVSILKQVPFQMIVFDEVHILKNIKSNQTVNARSLKSKTKIGLTGTVMQNDLKEFWTVLTTVHKPALSSWAQFNTFYAKPIKLARKRGARRSLRKQH